MQLHLAAEQDVDTVERDQGSSAPKRRITAKEKDARDISSEFRIAASGLDNW
ncbi:MAG: hypothetical protein Q9218_003461 [Villophora microphyllina]